MDFDDLGTFIDYLASAEADLDEAEMRQELEALFAPLPCWSDNLEEEDNQTWVLCFVSNASASCTWHTCWIYKVNSDGSYRSYSSDKKGFLYATPIDLNLRYGNGKDALPEPPTTRREL